MPVIVVLSTLLVRIKFLIFKLASHGLRAASTRTFAMRELKLTATEAEVLRSVLATLVLKDRTGEVGLMHGADRFVSSQQILRLPQRETLDAVSRKLGLAAIRRYAG